MLAACLVVAATHSTATAQAMSSKESNALPRDAQRTFAPEQQPAPGMPDASVAQPCVADAAISEVKRATEQPVPPSRIHSRVRLTPGATYRLPPLNSPAGQKGAGKRMQVGVVRPLSLNPLTRAKWYDLGAAGTAGIVAVTSEGAAQVRLYFSRVALPVGAKLYVYSLKNPGEIYGAYEGRGPSGDGAFWTPPVEGDGIVVEYFSPRRVRSRRSKPPFQIKEVSHIFQN